MQEDGAAFSLDDGRIVEPKHHDDIVEPSARHIASA